MASSGHLLNQLQLSLLQASYKGIESVLPEVMTEISDVIAGAMLMVLHGAHWIHLLCPGHPLALPNPRLKDCFASSELDLRLCTNSAKGQGNHIRIRPQLGLLWTEWCVARIVHSHFKTHWTPTGNCSSILGHLILLLQVSTNRRYFKWRHSALGHSFPRSFPNHIFQNFLFKIARVKNSLPRSSLPCETEAKARLRKSNSTKGVAPLTPGWWCWWLGLRSVENIGRHLCDLRFLQKVKILLWVHGHDEWVGNQFWDCKSNGGRRYGLCVFEKTTGWDPECAELKASKKMKHLIESFSCNNSISSLFRIFL